MKNNRTRTRKPITTLEPVRTVCMETKKQLDELYRKDVAKFAKFLREKTGISMTKITVYQFTDDRGNLLGDTLYDSVDDILAEAGVEVDLA